MQNHLIALNTASCADTLAGMAKMAAGMAKMADAMAADHLKDSVTVHKSSAVGKTELTRSRRMARDLATPTSSTPYPTMTYEQRAWNMQIDRKKREKTEKQNAKAREHFESMHLGVPLSHKDFESE